MMEKRLSRCGVRWAAVLTVAVAAVFAVPELSEAAGPGRGARAGRGVREPRARGVGRGSAERGRMGFERRRALMPVECPDFNSALGAWNTFYKRSLLATKGGKTGERPLGDSRVAWYQVLSRYYADPPAEYAEDARWQTGLATITGHLHMAEWMAAGGDMAEAHEALEPVRRIWMDIRTRNGVRSFGDEVTRFHDVMEPVVLWGAGQTHGGVTEENIREFDAEVWALAEAWDDVIGFGFQPRNQRGPGGQLMFRVSMSSLDRAIRRLRLVVGDRLYEEIPEAALEVRAAFVPVFMQFG